MKRLLFILAILFSLQSFSQTIVNRGGPANTVADQRFQATKNLYLPRYNDTTTANIAGASMTVNNIGIDSCGAKIYTRSPQAVWTRYCNPKRWVREGSDNTGSEGSFTIINDSTLVICKGNGVCDTVHFHTTINNINNIQVITDSSIRICHIDTASGAVTQVCDTIIFAPPAPPIISDFFQNGLRRVLGTHIVEFGDNTATDPRGGPAQITHNTALDLKFFVLSVPQLTIYDYGLQIKKYPHFGFQNGTGLQSWLHEDGLNGVRPDNGVRLGINYTSHPYQTTPSFIAGYFPPFKGYWFGANITGDGAFGLHVDSDTSKTAGIFVHTIDTANTYGVTIYARPPTAGPFITGMENYYVAHFRTNGDWQAPFYPNTRNDGVTGVAFYPDANGNVKVGPVSGGSSVSIVNDSTIRVCSFGGVCSTFVTHSGHKIQTVFVLDSTHLRVCDTSLTICDTLVIPKTGFDRGHFDPNQVSLADMTHATNGHNYTIGNGSTTSPTGTSDNYNWGITNTIVANATRNFVFLTNNNVGGSENSVFGRNLNVRGNTNFAAATDGTIKSSANYSAIFNDANDNWGTASMTIGFGNDNYVTNGFTGGESNVNGYTATDGLGTPNLYSDAFIFGIQNRSVGTSNFVGGSYMFPNNATGNIIMFGKGFDVANRMTTTVANSFNVGFNKTTPDFEITSSKIRIDAARFEQHRTNTTTAAANDLTLPITGNLDSISGNTQINAITTADWQSGSVVRLFFGGTPVVKNNTTGGAGTAPLRLSGGVDFTAGAGDILTLVYEGTYWRESARSIAASTVAVNANEGLIDSSGYIQFGGPSSAHATLQNGRFIDGNGSSITLKNTNSATVLNVNNTSTGEGIEVTSTSGTAGAFVAANGAIVAQSFGSGICVDAISSSNWGIRAIGNGSAGAASFQMNNGANADSSLVVTIRKTGSGTSANGIGGYLQYAIQDNAGSIVPSNKLLSKFTSVTAGATTSQFDLIGKNAGTDNLIMSAYGSGVVGIGISSGYVATRLEVVDNSVPGSSIVKVSTTSTQAAGSNQRGIEVAMSGANTNGSQNTFGIYSVDTHTGSGSGNVGVQGIADNAGTNYGVAGQTSTSGAGNAGVRGVSLSTGYGVMADNTSTGSGLRATAASSSAYAMEGQVSTASTNTILSIAKFTGITSGTPANGIGSALELQAQASSGNQIASLWKAKWADVTNGTRTSVVYIDGVNNATTDDLLTMGDRATLTESSATTFASITVGSGKIAGGEIIVTIEANDGTDFQSRTQRFIYTAVNKAGTTTVTLGTVEEVVAVSGGTLTSTITAVDAGSGVINFKSNATSSLTQTTLRATYFIQKNF